MVHSVTFIPLLFTVISAATFADWPDPSGSTSVPATIVVKAGETYDGNLTRFISGWGGGDQSEGQDPVFNLEDGATIKNVVLGAPAADGIHCEGSCVIENCWWEDVGEDAATFKGAVGDTYLVSGGGAKEADDKVFQHNGNGSATIQNFQAENIGKLYRSCGNCVYNGDDRHVVIDSVKLTGTTKVIAGINENYGDSATLTNIEIDGTVEVVCETYTGTTDNSAEPVSVSEYKQTEDGDGKYCIYTTSDLTIES
ncbi:unnamed protein product [Bursaphelenchus okinawaensis]|uniref:Probable pectate lyase F n=1 Tax=Bursaphelenchus okinawaensis TaxID=465554 RepID=A0A811L8D5_9BILA|nr:unnamed protein product [Bursaphelenchus okinawaensis]CAG9121034.1 unnamed protein product [Bursaphelenchus okinawaensis]